MTIVLTSEVTSVHTACELLKTVSKKAFDHEEYQKSFTFDDLLTALVLADTPTAKKWAASIENTIAYVNAGNTSGTLDGARRIFRRRQQ